MINSDGGCTMPCDVAKAFGGGAGFRYVGRHAGGARRERRQRGRRERREFMLFYGMSSESAMNRHVGGAAKYRAAEGKTVKLPLRGPGGQYRPRYPRRPTSACTYVGASRLKELTKRTTPLFAQEQENRIFISSNILAGVNVRQPYPIPPIASPR